MQRKLFSPLSHTFVKMDTTHSNKRKAPQEEPTKKQDDSSDDDSDGTVQVRL